jgi:benzoyl-CoA-dihydrodiol lyase
VPPSSWERVIAERAAQFSEMSDRPTGAKGISLGPLTREFGDDFIRYENVRVDIDRPLRRATITIHGPKNLPDDLAGIHVAGDTFWPLAMARDLDDAILHLRLNEPELGVIVFRTEGDSAAVLAADALLEAHTGDWLVREVRHYLKRVLKRVDLTSRSLIALIEPGSCFAGTLAELVFSADRAIMFSGTRAGDNRPPATIFLSPLNFGAYPMGNGLTRLETRFFGETDSVGAANARIGQALDSAHAEELGLVTAIFDDVDWDDEVRMMLEERASFSPDALTAMEANLRFVGPETMETRIFGRLTAWQNWVFQRANAVGEQGALKRYGSGVKPSYDFSRV